MAKKKEYWDEHATIKQRNFNFARAAGLNSADAAIAAGYSDKQAGYSLVHNKTVQRHFDGITSQIADRHIATAKDRQEFWSRVMLNDPLVCDPVLDDEGNTIPDFINGGVKMQSIKMTDRLKASEILGKAQQDFIERTEVDVNINVIDQLMSEIEGNVLRPAIDGDSKRLN